MIIKVRYLFGHEAWVIIGGKALGSVLSPQKLFTSLSLYHLYIQSRVKRFLAVSGNFWLK